MVSAIIKTLEKMKSNPKGIRFNDKGKAKPYQVRQVLLAIRKLELRHGS